MIDSKALTALDLGFPADGAAPLLALVDLIVLMEGQPVLLETLPTALAIIRAVHATCDPEPLREGCAEPFPALNAGIPGPSQLGIPEGPYNASRFTHAAFLPARRAARRDSMTSSSVGSPCV